MFFNNNFFVTFFSFLFFAYLLEQPNSVYLIIKAVECWTDKLFLSFKDGSAPYESLPTFSLLNYKRKFLKKRGKKRKKKIACWKT